MDLATWISQNEKLIYKLASYFSDYASIEDLYQTGCMAVVKASQNYREDMGTKFSTFVYPYILGEMKSLVRENNPIKVSKEMLSLNNKVMEARTLLAQKLMRMPTNFELSSFLEMPEEEIELILNSNFFISSLDATYGDTDLMMHEIISDKTVDIDTLIMLKEAIENLEEPERSIMIKRYYEDMTQSEVALDLGLKQTFVSRREKKVLTRLRQTI